MKNEKDKGEMTEQGGSLIFDGRKAFELGRDSFYMSNEQGFESHRKRLR
jgi:hypothetical protein